MITHETLNVDSRYSIERIQSLHIHEKPNEHVSLELSAIVSSEQGYDIISQASQGDPIRVYDTESGSERTLFTGRISSLHQAGEGGVHVLRCTAVAATHDLDTTQKRRSFQDINMSYGELFDEVLKSYSKKQLLSTVDDDRMIPAPVIQYDETDWEFLKRMASHFNTVLYSDAGQAYPQLCVGFMQSKKRHEINPVKYKAKMDLRADRFAEANNAGLSDIDFFCYYVESDEIYSIGDEVQIFGRTMYVTEKEIELVGGRLSCRYRIAPKGSIYRPKAFNPRATGLQLEGRVLDTQGETVKVHLDIDEEQDIGTAYWFPFAPPTGSLMYCMPQHGTNVSVYIPDMNEQDSTVLGCVRKNGDACSKVADPSTRYFGTEHGSEMMMAPSSMHLMGSPAQGQLAMSMDDSAGVSYSSHSNLTISAAGNISMHAGNVVKIMTPKAVQTHSFTGSGWDLDGETNITSKQGEVILKGVSTATTAAIDEEVKKMLGEFMAESIIKKYFSN